MRLLLDTHAFLWWLEGNLRLSGPAQAAIGEEANAVHVSAASVWEITTKHRLGKLPGAGLLVQDVTAEIEAQGFTALPITTRHAERAGRLPGPHRDPFDRMLIAQALAEDLVLVSLEIP
ncbi:MAG TPA: type II toxin-antitoxin system VapC family toxin, partial [Paracoccaceae bacterium]|nr:type II toxin-antitoxin system VapC family toxin [Paracoccaceae bacterium]